ncbi:MAG: C25 family cysteine peptidase [Flavobacteriales bacterium]
MKSTKLMLLIALSIAAFTSNAQNTIQIIDESATQIHLTCEVDGIHTAETSAGVVIRLDKGTEILQAGNPDLPKLTTALIVDDSRAMAIEIVSSEYVEYTNISVAPSKGNLLRTVDPNSIPYTYSGVYETNAFFPGELASLGDAYVQGQYRGQSLHFYPVQYNPITQIVRVYSSIELNVVSTDVEGENQLPSAVPATINATMRDVYKSHFINYDFNADRYDAISEIGDMLVIYDAEYLEELQPWIEWKTEKGIKVIMQDVAEINSISAINNFLSDYYAENGLTYLVLVGDEDQVPSELLNNSGGQGYCDPCYGYVSGNDSYVEFFVGRLLVHQDNELPAVIDKILEYEKNPNTALDWFSVAMGIGSNEGDGFGDDNQADWQHNNGIKEELLGYTYTEVWEKYDGSHSADSPSGGVTADGSGSPSAASLTTVINDGCSLINYTGHGAHNLIVTGSYTNTQINELDNHGFYPFFIVVGCCTGDFDDDDASGDTFGEAWMKCPTGNYDSPTGGIGGSFSSVYQSWAPPMEGQDEMNAVITASSQAGNTRHTFGSIHYHGCHGMNDEYGSAGDEMTDTWILMADPTIQLRTAYPTQITATHPATGFFGMSEITIQCNTNEAMVALTFEGEIIATGIVVNNSVTLSFDAITTPGNILVTITSFNTIPYQATIEMIAAEGPYVVNNSQTVHDVQGNNDGDADYSEIITLDIPAENVGVEDAVNVVGTLSTDNSAIVLDDATHNYGDIAMGATGDGTDGYQFHINGYIEDQTVVLFTITFTDDNGNTWEQNFSVIISAPVIVCAPALTYDDSAENNNGRMDPGETVLITVPVTNDGHAATATDMLVTLTEDSPYLTITTSSVIIPPVAAEGAGLAIFTAEVAADCPQNAPVNFTVNTSSDYYGSDCAYEKNMNQIVEDWETGDISQYPWVMEDEVEWFVTPLNPFAGENCMQSGDISNNGITTLKLTIDVLEAGNVEFAYRTDCDALDMLKFRIGTATLGQFGGDNEWTTVSYPISTGTRVLRWIYDKDPAASLGADAVWIDDIILPNMNVISVVEETETTEGMDIYPNPANDRATLEFVNGTAGEVSITIENMLGEIVYQSDKTNMPLGTQFIQLDTQAWASGLYVVNVLTPSGNKTMKMIRK